MEEEKKVENENVETKTNTEQTENKKETKKTTEVMLKNPRKSGKLTLHLIPSGDQIKMNLVGKNVIGSRKVWLMIVNTFCEMLVDDGMDAEELINMLLKNKKIEEKIIVKKYKEAAKEKAKANEGNSVNGDNAKDVKLDSNALGALAGMFAGAMANKDSDKETTSEVQDANYHEDTQPDKQ